MTTTRGVSSGRRRAVCGLARACKARGACGVSLFHVCACVVLVLGVSRAVCVLGVSCVRVLRVLRFGRVLRA